MAGRPSTKRAPGPWPKADDGTDAVSKVDPSRISSHEARRRIRSFLASLDEQEDEGGEVQSVLGP
jgi:hypothetical protein